ncbi:MAG: hypothetical protein EB829_04345 [Nitrosopumilus sp. H8]|nr:MAG: hypothetical protein EB829_04345 [Nitrosopumilus sp. H8]
MLRQRFQQAVVRHYLKLPFILGFIPTWFSHSYAEAHAGMLGTIAIIIFQCISLKLFGVCYRKLPLIFVFILLFTHRGYIEGYINMHSVTSIIIVAMLCICVGIFSVWFADWVRHGRRWITSVAIVFVLPHSFYLVVLIYQVFWNIGYTGS